MWRSNFDADWERKKEYLIRSLFQDVPSLSPVPEEDESFDSSRPRIIRSPIIPQRVHRPPSPLPPLIIEKEPNRHDEPEEYYKELEKRVLKVYRKLFIEGGNETSSNHGSNFETSVDMDYISNTSFEKAIDSNVINTDINNPRDLDQVSENSNRRSSLKRTISQDKDENLNSSKYKKSKSTEVSRSSTDTQPKSTTNDDDDVSDTMSSSDEDPGNDETEIISNDVDNDTTIETNEGLQVTFKAVVHRDGGDYQFVRQPSVADETNENVKEMEDVEDISDGAVILENSAVSDVHRHAEQTEEIDITEVMRSQHFRPSRGSLHNEDHASSSYERIEHEEEPRLLERHTESVSSPDEVPISIELDTNFDLPHRRSTMERIGSNNEEDISRFRRNSSSSSSERSSVCSYVDAEVQTCLDNEGVNRTILKDIFVGTPRVFNLCSCANHSCNR